MAVGSALKTFGLMTSPRNYWEFNVLFKDLRLQRANAAIPFEDVGVLGVGHLLFLPEAVPFMMDLFSGRHRPNIAFAELHF